MIETTIDDRFVATVTVNNPEQRNALGNAGKRELAEAIEKVSATTGLRVVILTGAGDTSFIGGANLKEMSSFVRHDASEGPALTHRVCEAIRRTPVPVIARINGWCLGAGLEIAASCDMRAAADNARFGMPEVLFGLPSGMEACLLPQLIGWGKTRELVFPAGTSTAPKPWRAIWSSEWRRRTSWIRRWTTGWAPS
jgi:enoyl-CoA hydratase/carnithine racemase